MAWEPLPRKSPESRCLVSKEVDDLQQKTKRMLSRKTEILAQIVDAKLLEGYIQGSKPKRNTKSGIKRIYSSKDQHPRESFNTDRYTIKMNDNFRIILSRKNAVVGNTTQGVTP